MQVSPLTFGAHLEQINAFANLTINSSVAFANVTTKIESKGNKDRGWNNWRGNGPRGFRGGRG